MTMTLTWCNTEQFYTKNPKAEKHNFLVIFHLFQYDKEVIFTVYACAVMNVKFANYNFFN